MLSMNSGSLVMIGIEDLWDLEKWDITYDLLDSKPFEGPVDTTWEMLWLEIPNNID